MKQMELRKILTVFCLIIFTLSFGLFSGCTDNDHVVAQTPTETVNTPTPTITPTPTPEPLYYYSADYYLVVEDDGLFSLGWKPEKGEREIYDEKRLWLPNEFEVDMEFFSYIFIDPGQIYVVKSVDDTSISKAGYFTEVVRLEFFNNVLWSYLKFKPLYGILWYRTGSAYGHLDWNYYLTDLSIFPSGNPQEDYFALSVGNRWEYYIKATPWPEYGYQTIAITGTEVIDDREVFVFSIEKIIYDGKKLLFH